MATTKNTKPQILVSVSPIYGHITPILVVVKDLIARGFEVTVVSTSVFEEKVSDLGAQLVPIQGYGDSLWSDGKTLQGRMATPSGIERFLYDMEHIFIAPIPSQHEAIQRAIAVLRKNDRSRPIILVSESFYLGAIPVMMGAPGLKPDGIIVISATPLTLTSMDTAPFGPGLPPDSSSDGRKRNIAMAKQTHEEMFKNPRSRFRALLTELGVTKEPPHFLDAVILLPDRFLQMCVPSVEYPRSDAPDTIIFTGGLPKQKREPYSTPPSWWADVVSNPNKKRIIALAQGTAAVIYDDLIIPTITALKDRHDVIVIAALGVRGATLPPAFDLPRNTHVEDYIPYDEMLALADVFVTNGGYGGFQHALSHGVPLVMAGVTEDKGEVSARAEWAGVAVNLKTSTPTVEAVYAAVNEVLTNPRYKTRAVEIEREMASCDPMGVIAGTIEELAALKTSN